MLKCFTGRFSSFSAKNLSFRGRPRPLAAGALDRVCFTPTGVACRISWLSTSSSCCREQGPQVQPYPRDGFAMSGGCTHRIWKYFLQRSHSTESALYAIIKHGFLRRKKNGQNYVGHHSWHESQRRILSVKSGMTSFSATTNSYREISTSRMLSGTVPLLLIPIGKISKTRNAYDFEHHEKE